jgi:hypothetical protein
VFTEADWVKHKPQCELTNQLKQASFSLTGPKETKLQRNLRNFTARYDISLMAALVCALDLRNKPENIDKFAVLVTIVPRRTSKTACFVLKDVDILPMTTFQSMVDNMKQVLEMQTSEHHRLCPAPDRSITHDVKDSSLQIREHIDLSNIWPDFVEYSNSIDPMFQQIFKMHKANREEFQRGSNNEHDYATMAVMAKNEGPGKFSGDPPVVYRFKPIAIFLARYQLVTDVYRSEVTFVAAITGLLDLRRKPQNIDHCALFVTVLPLETSKTSRFVLESVVVFPMANFIELLNLIDPMSKQVFTMHKAKREELQRDTKKERDYATMAVWLKTKGQGKFQAIYQLS